MLMRTTQRRTTNCSETFLQSPYGQSTEIYIKDTGVKEETEMEIIMMVSRDVGMKPTGSGKNSRYRF